MRYETLPSQARAEVCLLVHRDDLHLLVDEDGRLAFSPTDQCELIGRPMPVDGEGVWWIVCLDATVRPSLDLAPVCVAGKGLPSRQDFRHAYIAELCLATPRCHLDPTGISASPICTPNGRPVFPLDSLLFKMMYATDVDGGDWDVVASTPIEVYRLLLSGRPLNLELTSRETHELPLVALERTEQEYQADPAGFFRVYFGEDDFWLVARAEADRGAFL